MPDSHLGNSRYVFQRSFARVIKQDTNLYLVKIGVSKGDMVIAGNAISKSRQTFLDSLDHNCIR